MQGALEDKFELHVLRQRKFLAEARGDHEGCGGGNGCAHGRVLFIFFGDSWFGAYECGFGRGEDGGLLCIVGGADFAFAIVEHADGVDSGGVNQVGDEGNPACRTVDFIEGEPEASAADFSGGLNLVNVAADLGAGGEGGAFRRCQGLEGAGLELLSHFVFFGGDDGLQGNQEAGAARSGVWWRVWGLRGGILRLSLRSYR